MRRLTISARGRYFCVKNVRDYTNFVINTIFPIRNGIEAEAYKVSDNRQEQLEHFHKADFATRHIVEMLFLGLRSMWEKEIASWLYEETVPKVLEKNVVERSLRQYRDTIQLFQDHGIKVSGMPFHERLTELHLLCNAIKHGDGNSCTELFNRRRELFHPYDIRPDLETRSPHGASVRWLVLSEQNFREYSSAIESFWNHVPIHEEDSSSEWTLDSLS